MQEGQTAWTLPPPPPGGRAGSARPFTRAAAPQSGERSGPDPGHRVPGDVSAPARETGNPSQRPGGLHAFRALLPTCKGKGQAARGSPSFLHSKQTRHKHTKQSLEWSPLLPSRGAARRHGGGRAQIAHATPKVTHLKRQHTGLPWVQAKAKPQPRIQEAAFGE